VGYLRRLNCVVGQITATVIKEISMPYSRELAFRKMRSEFDRFPNIELVEKIELGQIGFFNSRRAVFNWRTSLKTLGINFTPKSMGDLPPIINEVYTSDDAVDYEFSLDANNFGKATFKFDKSYSLATQSIDLTSKGYEIDKLQNDILRAIQGGTKWEQDWVLVTQVFTSPSFSLLIASGRTSEADITTQVPISATGFNIADPSLNLTLTRSKRMAYRSLGRQDVTPFFRVHKFKGDWSNLRSLRLEPYGRD
jgi:hypothetical protein